MQLNTCPPASEQIFKKCYRAFDKPKYRLSSMKPIYLTVFKFAIAADYSDKGLNLYCRSLDMKLNIPKCQNSFTLLQLCVLLEV